MDLDLSSLGVTDTRIHRNLAPAELVEHAIRSGDGTLTLSGALAARSGGKTGRSPQDKRIVEHPESRDEIWWGAVNRPLRPRSFARLRRRAVDYLNTHRQLFVVDGFAGWDPQRQLKIRVVSTRPYHALFMHNMLIRPTSEQQHSFGEPDFTILNAGRFPADPDTAGVGSETSVSISFEERQMVLLGTEYAGEMKKGVFSLMHYWMPARDALSLHCSANEGPDGDVSLFFGLSGTGKTTLSADPARRLIGDDEHYWTDDGVFNIEGGCYAKCLGLSRENEPQIYDAIRFGAVLENTVQDADGRVDFDDDAITPNTRAAYPIEHIPGVKTPCRGGHPANLILLTCDAFGVLPPVSKLTSNQAMEHFLAGYTAKIAGTEQGVREPEATFSPCFGGAFLVRPPSVYGDMLAEKIQRHGSQAWLLNTGWIGGGYGVGQRMQLKHTRAILDAIHSGHLQDVATESEPVFGLAVPREAPGVPSQLLQPRACWRDGAAYDRAATKLQAEFERQARETAGRNAA